MQIMEVHTDDYKRIFGGSDGPGAACSEVVPEGALFLPQGGADAAAEEVCDDALIHCFACVARLLHADDRHIIYTCVYIYVYLEGAFVHPRFIPAVLGVAVHIYGFCVLLVFFWVYFFIRKWGYIDIYLQRKGIFPALTMHASPVPKKNVWFTRLEVFPYVALADAR